MNIYTWAWGVGVALFGLNLIIQTLPIVTLIEGIAFLIAGIAFIANNSR